MLPHERGRFMAWRSAQAWTWTVHGLEVSPGLDVDGSWPGGQPRIASTKAAGSNGARSSGPSPRPTSLTGTPSSRWTAMTIPPLAVPSSLVRMIPVMSTTSANTRAWRSPFWPVVASRTSRTSSTVARFSMTRLILPSSSISPVFVCSRPAVSTMTASTRRAMPSLTASKATLAGSAPSRSERTTRAPTRAPQVSSWSAAAARNVSAAPSSTVRPSPTRARASLPQAVVLPVPFTVALDVQRAVHVRADRADEFAAQHGPHVIRVPRASHPDLGLELLNDLAGRTHAHVRGEQCVLDVLPCLVIQGATGEQAEQHRTEPRLRPGQAAAQPGQPTSQRWRLLNAGGFRLRRRRQHGCWRTSRARLAGLAGRTRRGWRGPGRRWRRGRPAAPRAEQERAAADYH